MLFRFLLAAALAIGLAAPLAAQIMPRGSGRQPAVQPRQVDVQGTFEGAVKGAILLLDDKNQRWQVALAPGATVHVTGTATADFLRSGPGTGGGVPGGDRQPRRGSRESRRADGHDVRQGETAGALPARRRRQRRRRFRRPGRRVGRQCRGRRQTRQTRPGGRRQRPRRGHVPHRRRTDGRPHRQTLGPRRPHHRPVQIGRRAEDWRRHGRLQPCPQRGQGLDQGNGAAEPAGDRRWPAR